jgi:phenylalanyl-tRNA synthetase beta chain
MVKLLSNVEFGVKVSGQNLSVTAPFWRTDIEYPEDIVEEVGRLYGYDKSTLQLPIRSSRPSPINPILNLKSDIRNVLAKSGTNEVLSYSFVHGKLLEQSNQSPEKAYQIANALSPDLQYYRLSISPSLLDKIHPNIKAGFDYFGLFEIGKTRFTGQYPV